MRMVNNARGVFGQLPPIPEGLSLEQGPYDQLEVESWLKEEHGVMFMDADEVGGANGMIGNHEWQVAEEDLGAVPEAVWDETLGEPEMTVYDLESRGDQNVAEAREEDHR